MSCMTFSSHIGRENDKQPTTHKLIIFKIFGCIISFNTHVNQVKFRHNTPNATTFNHVRRIICLTII